MYLGGLLDLTGEIGRVAVEKATAREEVVLKECLETVMVVSVLNPLLFVPVLRRGKGRRQGVK
ncbi:unnamed protein product [Discosporangium mesarthrocarpum]